MKLSQVTAEQPPTIIVPIKYANSDKEGRVGLRMLRLSERSDAIIEARSFAAQRGSSVWNQEDPLCAMGLYLAVVSRAAFDADSGPSVPFCTVQELLEHPLMGQENLAYLYDAYETFEEEHHIRTKELSIAEVVDTCIRIAQGDDDFLGRLRPGILRALLRITAGPWLTSQMAKSLSTSDDTQGQESPLSTEYERVLSEMESDPLKPEPTTPPSS